LLGALIYGLSRNLAWYLPTIGFLMAALHLSNAGKLVVLGGPIMPDDVLAVSNLFQLFDGWQLVGVAVVVVEAMMAGIDRGEKVFNKKKYGRKK